MATPARRRLRPTEGVSRPFCYIASMALSSRIGHPHCWQCGEEMVRHTPAQVTEEVLKLPEGTRFAVLAPVARAQLGSFAKELAELRKLGFVRATIDGAIRDLSEDLELD